MMAGGTGTRAAGWMMAVGLSLVPAGGVILRLSDFPSGLGLAGGGLAALGIVTGLLGLALYVLLPAFSERERVYQDYGSHRVVLACTLFAAAVGNFVAALYLLPMALFGGSGARDGSRLLGGSLSPLEIAVAAVSLDVALLAVVYLRVVRPGAIPWSAMGLGLRDLPGRLALGLLFGALLFAASGLLELLLAQMGIHQTQNALFQSVRRASPGEFGLVLLAGAAVAPAVEEIYFRGYVFRAYLSSKGTGRAFLFSAALFAVVHIDLPALLPIFVMGLMLAFLYYRTGSVVPSIVAHSLNNAVALTLLYLGLA